MGSGSEIARHADALWEASESRVPIEPLTTTAPQLDVADAYAIQLANVERALAAGRSIAGHKVGLTSKAMQEMLGVDEPDFGVLLDDMVLGDGAVISTSRLVRPRVEAEIAFRLARDLEGPDVTTEAALGALAVAIPALEIIDSRIADWRIRLVDTVADNGSSALVVLGGTETPVTDVDLPAVEVAVEHNGDVVERGTGAAVLGHPAACVAWLANKLSEFGQVLHAGQIIMPGAVHRAFDVGATDVVRARFTGLGDVTARFAEGVT
jgi:2-keto-4-pentenoate hydratase